MKAHWYIALATGEKQSILMRQLRRLALGVSFTLLFSGLAFAQYGGGSMGTGSSTPSYGSGKAIGIGVGAAAAGAGVVFLAMRHAGLVTGCVEAGDDGLQLVDAKNRTYSLLPGTAAVKAGERVELQGKRSEHRDSRTGSRHRSDPDHARIAQSLGRRLRRSGCRPNSN